MGELGFRTQVHLLSEPWPCHSSKGDAGQGLKGSERISTSLPRESGRLWSQHTLTVYSGLGGLLSILTPGLLYCPHMGHSTPEACRKHPLSLPSDVPAQRQASLSLSSPTLILLYRSTPFFPAPPSATSPPKPVHLILTAHSALHPECPGNGCGFSNMTKCSATCPMHMLAPPWWFLKQQLNSLVCFRVPKQARQPHGSPF